MIVGFLFGHCAYTGLAYNRIVRSMGVRKHSKKQDAYRRRKKIGVYAAHLNLADMRTHHLASKLLSVFPICLSVLARMLRMAKSSLHSNMVRGGDLPAEKSRLLLQMLDSVQQSVVFTSEEAASRYVDDWNASQHQAKMMDYYDYELLRLQDELTKAKQALSLLENKCRDHAKKIDGAKQLRITMPQEMIHQPYFETLLQQVELEGAVGLSFKTWKKIQTYKRNITSLEAEIALITIAKEELLVVDEG